MIELRGGLVIDRRPRRAAIERHACATILALDHPLLMPWIDPQVMVIAMRCGHLGKCASTVNGFPGLDVEDIDGVGILRVGEDMAIVPKAQAQIALLTEPLPGR